MDAESSWAGWGLGHGGGCEDGGRDAKALMAPCEQTNLNTCVLLKPSEPPGTQG